MTKQIAPTAEMPVDGQTVVLCGSVYTVPPLTLFNVRRFADRLKNLDLRGGMDPEKLDLIAEVVHAGLKRNYPEMTLEQVLELLDLSNVYRVMEAVMGVSGFEPAKGGDPSGESTGRG